MDGIRPAAVALTAVALAVCYAPTLGGMFYQWTTDEDMGHGFAVPFVILWILWRERDRWRTLTPNPSAWGFVPLAAGAALECSAAVGAGLFAAALGRLVPESGAMHVAPLEPLHPVEAYLVPECAPAPEPIVQGPPK